MHHQSNPGPGQEPDAERLADHDARWVGDLAALAVYTMDPVAGLELNDADALIDFADKLSGYVDVARWNRDGQTAPLSERGLGVLRTIYADEVADVEEQRRKAAAGNPVEAEDLASMERRLKITADALEKAEAA